MKTKSTEFDYTSNIPLDFSSFHAHATHIETTSGDCPLIFFATDHVNKTESISKITSPAMHRFQPNRLLQNPNFDTEFILNFDKLNQFDGHANICVVSISLIKMLHF